MRLLILLTPARLEVAVLRGKFIDARRSCPHAVANWKEEWPRSLGRLTEHLRSFVSEFGASGWPATVLYHSPSAATGVYSCPAAAGRKAEKAAALALADGAGFSVESNPACIERLVSDPRARAAPTNPPQIHFLGAADTDASVSAVASWAAGAGVKPDMIVPLAAPVLAAAVHDAVEASKDCSVALLWLGEDESVLAAASHGCLRFVRTVAVGLESLIGVLTGEIAAAPGEAPVVLDRASAAELLASRGIPAPGTNFDEARSLAAGSVLPLLQPVLQRLVVETKHSLRFGLEEAERAGARLMIGGPGAAVPRLGRVIAENIGLALAEQAHSDAPGRRELTALDVYIERPWCGLTLRPVEDDRAGAARNALRSLWIGVGAAVVLVLVQGLLATLEVKQQQSRLRTLEEGLAASARHSALARETEEARAAVSALRRRISAAVGDAPAWDGLLVFLSDETPPDVRVTELEMSYDGGRPVCRLSGVARAEAGGDPGAIVKRYLESLGSAPIVESARLGGTQRSDENGFSTQQFQVTLSLVALPAHAAAASIADAESPASGLSGGQP